MTQLTAPRTGWSGTREAEHALTSSGMPVLSACTHFASSTSTVLVTVEVDGGGVEVLGAAQADDLEAARDLHARRLGGRLFVFPGSTQMEGVMSVGQLMDLTAVDEVVMIGHRDPVPADQLIDTQSFVRPELADGLVRLVVRPAADGLVIPFEQPNPTPCCADH